MFHLWKIKSGNKTAGSHHGDHICHLGQQNLIASDSSEHLRQLRTFSAKLVAFYKMIFLSSFYKQLVYEQLTLGTLS